MALLLVAALFAGCAAPAAAPAPEAAAEAAPAEAEAAPAEAAPAEAAAGDVIELEYWQYNFESRVNAMNQLIEQFEAENPGIKILHNSDIPYDQFRDKIAASVPAGVGPDVVTLFYSWQPSWVAADYIVPLPADAFPPEEINAQFSPLVQASFQDGQLYTLPTAVRTLALFYNKDLMTAAGLDPENPPTTLEELAEQAVQCTTFDADGNYEVMGFPVSMSGQAHNWFREILLRQYGQEPQSEDNRTILWNASQAGYDAWNELLKFEMELKTGDATLFDGDPNFFLSGKACFHIDGSFRLGTIANNAPDLNFGVTEMPTANDVKMTFGSYWTHGITNKAAADPARLEAAVKFLQFITTPAAGTLWVAETGELPAQLEAASDPALLADPNLGAFAAGLPYAASTFLVDESVVRQSLLDAYDAVKLNGADPAEELDFAVQTSQELYDEFWAEN
jgi:multiple sugar transport system substrate-binding protein